MTPPLPRDAALQAGIAPCLEGLARGLDALNAARANDPTFRTGLGTVMVAGLSAEIRAADVGLDPMPPCLGDDVAGHAGLARLAQERDAIEALEVHRAGLATCLAAAPGLRHRTLLLVFTRKTALKIEARLDGYPLCPMASASRIAQVLATVSARLEPFPAPGPDTARRFRIDSGRLIQAENPETALITDLILRGPMEPLTPDDVARAVHATDVAEVVQGHDFEARVRARLMSVA